jgi:integrase/recombinase XerC
MFAAQSHRRGLAPRSVQRRLSAVRSLFRYLIREGEMRHDPAADVQAPKARKRLPTTLDADTMAKLLTFRGDDRLGVRDQSWSCSFLGLSLAELLGLDLQHLDADRRVLIRAARRASSRWARSDRGAHSLVAGTHGDR